MSNKNFYQSGTDAPDVLYQRLHDAVLSNYDEILSELEEPAISLSLYEGKFEITDEIKRLLPDLPENVFVDELFGDLSDVENGFGLTLCFAVPYDDGDGFERVDEIDVEELSPKYLQKLVVYAEQHKGMHIK